MSGYLEKGILPWREAGPPNHHDDKVDSDQYVVNKELSLCACLAKRRSSPRRACQGFRVLAFGVQGSGFRVWVSG